MNSFVQQHAGSVIGTLSGFDRILFRGTLTRLCNGGGLFDLMRKAGYLLKDFGNFCGKVTGEVVAASEQSAKEAGRPKVHLFNPSVRKEEVAKEIARRDGIESGLVCLLTAVEPCWTFAFNPNGRNKGRETKVLTACRRSGIVTRQLRLLRSHHLINKVPRTHRYQISSTGRALVTALTTARQADTSKLLSAAA